MKQDNLSFPIICLSTLISKLIQTQMIQFPHPAHCFSWILIEFLEPVNLHSYCEEPEIKGERNWFWFLLMYIDEDVILNVNTDYRLMDSPQWVQLWRSGFICSSSEWKGRWLERSSEPSLDLWWIIPCRNQGPALNECILVSLSKKQRNRRHVIDNLFSVWEKFIDFGFLLGWKYY